MYIIALGHIVNKSTWGQSNLHGQKSIEAVNYMKQWTWLGRFIVKLTFFCYKCKC